MSFYPQPGSYQCGPFALKYALIMLGKIVDEKMISEFAGSTWWAGTDEFGLGKAAKKLNCRLKHFVEYTPKDALKLLNKNLSTGNPSILSVKNWEHWATVIKHSKGSYILIDSDREKVINILSANALVRYWKCNFEKENYSSFDGYTLIPKFKVKTRAKFTIEKAKKIMQKKHESLAFNWDQYFNDLRATCVVKNNKLKNYLTFKQFRNRHGNKIIYRVADWHGIPAYSELEQILDNFEMAASIYNFVVPIKGEKKAIIDITSLLMMYVCGKYGMDKIY